MTFLLLHFLLSGCKPKQTTLLMNVHTDREQARASCGNEGSACVGLATTQVAGYETEFVSAFASEHQCHGIELSIGSEDGQAGSQTDWRFDIARFEPKSESDDPVFHWTLFKGDAYTKGYKMYQGDYADLKHEKPSQAAESICKIINGVGGSTR